MEEGSAFASLHSASVGTTPLPGWKMIDGTDPMAVEAWGSEFASSRDVALSHLTTDLLHVVAAYPTSFLTITRLLLNYSSSTNGRVSSARVNYY